MSRKSKTRQTLEEILQSTSETLFPDKMGQEKIFVDTKDCCNDTPLHILTHRGNDYGCQLIIEAGADVNAVGDLGYTPLHYAVMTDNVKMIELLLKYGANPAIACEFGETPIDIAKRQSPETLKVLRKTD